MRAGSLHMNLVLSVGENSSHPDTNPVDVSRCTTFTLLFLINSTRYSRRRCRSCLYSSLIAVSRSLTWFASRVRSADCAASAHAKSSKSSIAAFLEASLSNSASRSSICGQRAPGRSDFTIKRLGERCKHKLVLSQFYCVKLIQLVTS